MNLLVRLAIIRLRLGGERPFFISPRDAALDRRAAQLLLALRAAKEETQ